jgi:CHAT domain-containing protein
VTDSEFRPWTQDPVLVSDAAASAYPTEIGICHLQAAYYPNASVFGHAYTRLDSSGVPVASGSAAATSADVLAALPHETSPGASLLHFGGHGRAQVPGLSSYLDLDTRKDAEESAEKDAEIGVAVKRILQQARTRSSSVSGGLIVLASCLTDVTEADYDEALTLATAFLSAGGAGVVAARWRVSDVHTALFMTVFHSCLNGPYPRPVEAVRAAQLWMLDPGRAVPDGLPAVLRDEATEPVLADPVAWAGFAYQGQ